MKWQTLLLKLNSFLCTVEKMPVKMKLKQRRTLCYLQLLLHRPERSEKDFSFALSHLIPSFGSFLG